MSRLLFILLLLHLMKADWIDPHSMDTNHKNKLPNKVVQHSPHMEAQEYAVVNKCDIHLKRLVRIMLNNAVLNQDLPNHEGYINIRLTAVEHQFLVNFSQSAKTVDNICSEVSSIFENALRKPVADRYQELAWSLQERIYEILLNPISSALIGACCVLYVTYKLLNYRWKSVVKFFVCLAYISDFFITYLSIVRDEEIENMVNIKKLASTPPECDPNKMSWWTFITAQVASSFTENPCKAYYQATYPSSMYIIAPSKVLTRQFRTLIVEPFGDIGEAFGKFGRAMFSSLPWGLNVVLFPVMLVTMCVIVFIIFLFFTKPHFKLRIFPFVTLEMGNSTSTEGLLRKDNRRSIEGIEGRNRNRRKRGREVGMSTNHRALLEDVSNDNSSSRGKKEVTNREEPKDKEKVLDCEKKLE